MVTTATAFFEESRFLWVNGYGCVIERQELNDETIIDV